MNTDRFVNKIEQIQKTWDKEFEENLSLRYSNNNNENHLPITILMLKEIFYDENFDRFINFLVNNNKTIFIHSYPKVFDINNHNIQTDMLKTKREKFDYIFITSFGMLVVHFKEELKDSKDLIDYNIIYDSSKQL